MRYAKAPPRDFRCLPGLHGPRIYHRSICPFRRSIVLATRETRHILFTILIRGLSLSPAGCVDLAVHQRPTPRRLPSSSSTRQKWQLLHKIANNCFRSRYNHNTHLPTTRGDAGGVHGWVAGHRKQHRSCCFFGRQTRHSYYYCCFRHISTFVASHDTWKPKSRRASFDRGC